jgi:hypothetical protein
MPKFELTVDPTVQSYEIEIAGLPAGTNATLSVTAVTSAGAGPAAELPLTVAAAAPVIPGAPVIVAVADDTAQSGTSTSASEAQTTSEAQTAETAEAPAEAQPAAS